MIKKLQNIYFYSFLNFIDKILIFILPLIVLKLYDDKDLYNSINYAEAGIAISSNTFQQVNLMDKPMDVMQYIEILCLILFLV